MIAYLIRRLVYGLSVLWGVVTLVFIIFSLKPGDPAEMLLGQRATPESIAAVKKELGLDLPVLQRYVLYLNDLSPVSFHTRDESSHYYLDETKYSPLIEFGTEGALLVFKAPYLRQSYKSRRAVKDIIFDAMPGTILLAVSAILFAIIIGMATGIIAALRKDSLFDKGALFLAVLGMSSPSFYMAIIIAWVGGFLWYDSIPLPLIPVVAMLALVLIRLLRSSGRNLKSILSAAGYGLLIGYGLHGIHLLLYGMFDLSIIPLGHERLMLPGTGLEQSGSYYEVDVFTGPYLAIENLILPMLTLGIRPLAIIIQLMRNAMLEELSKDYIRTARAKGLSERSIILRHALRNALNPLVTAVSGWFASLLAGAVFIEFIFGWKGLGLQVYFSLVNEDFPVVIGSVIVISSIFVLINMAVDILYGIIDPRVRIGA